MLSAHRVCPSFPARLDLPCDVPNATPTWMSLETTPSTAGRGVASSTATIGFPAAFIVTPTEVWVDKASQREQIPVGTVALAVERQKLQKNGQHCRPLGLDFIPPTADSAPGLQSLKKIT